MADPNPGTEVKSPNLFDRAKEEIGAILHRESSGNHNHHRETHGLRDDIDENTPIGDVKAPNVLERAREEIEAIVHSIHGKKNHRDESQKEESKSEALVSSAVLHRERPHHKETHGMRDDIDESTPLSEVKAPSILERAKEEIEALVQTIHPKKERNIPISSPKKSKGFMMRIGSLLERVCAPRGGKKD